MLRHSETAKRSSALFSDWGTLVSDWRVRMYRSMVVAARRHQWQPKLHLIRIQRAAQKIFLNTQTVSRGLSKLYFYHQKHEKLRYLAFVSLRDFQHLCQSMHFMHKTINRIPKPTFWAIGLPGHAWVQCETCTAVVSCCCTLPSRSPHAPGAICAILIGMPWWVDGRWL
jgi:hypothetical protein